MFMLSRMRSALAAGCPDPTLARALTALKTLRRVVRDPNFPFAEHLVDAYFTAFGEALRYVYIDMLAPFLPTEAQLRSITPSTTVPSSTVFLFGICTHTLRIASTRRPTPAERLFRLLTTQFQTPVLLGIFCLMAYYDDEMPADHLDAALTVGLALDPTHPLFVLTRARLAPPAEREHWARRGLQATSAPLYTVMFQACIDPVTVDTGLYERCVRPWLPAFVDRAVLRPLFEGRANTVDMDAYTLAFTCDGCDAFALHLRRGVCSRACARRQHRRSPEKAFAALKLSVEALACATCGGRRNACYCTALSFFESRRSSSSS